MLFGHGHKQQRVGAGALELCFAHQQVQHQAGQVVSQRLGHGVLFLIDDLAVAAAFLAGFCQDLFTSAFKALVVNALGGFAVRALDAHHMPFAGAGAAVCIAVAGHLAADAYNAGDRFTGADRADAGGVGIGYVAGAEAGRALGEGDLQRCHDEVRHAYMAGGHFFLQQLFGNVCTGLGG